MYEKICGICFDSCNNNNIIRLICTHIFCNKCIFRYLKIKNECPICKCNNNETLMVKLIKDISFRDYENKYNTEIINFEKHKNKTFIWVYKNDKKYCSWCEKSFDNNINRNQNFKDFVYYISQKKQK